jgi:hypothetical protein
LDAPPNMTADGTQHYGLLSTWNGSTTMTTAGTADTTCGNWQSSTSASTVLLGVAGDTLASHFFGTTTHADCTAIAYLTCLQE